jgi:hypothetical protein
MQLRFLVPELKINIENLRAKIINEGERWSIDNAKKELDSPSMPYLMYSRS